MKREKTRTKINGKAHYWCRIGASRGKQANDKTNLYFICQIKFPIFFESTLRTAKHFLFCALSALKSGCCFYPLRPPPFARNMQESTEIINMMQFKVARNVKSNNIVRQMVNRNNEHGRIAYEHHARCIQNFNYCKIQQHTHTHTMWMNEQTR